MSNVTRISLIGFGEVGQTLAADLLARDQCSVCAWDIQFSEGLSIPSRGLRDIKVRQATDPRDAVAQADLIISAVTAAEDMKAARSVASHIEPDSYFLDVNSVSPGMKKQVAQMIAAAGGRYVEAAVMTSVPPHGIRVPMLLGGAHAAPAGKLLRELGFEVEAVSADLGVASAIKLCRSVIIKGLESLVVESFTAARSLGVERQVLASLKETYPQFDWEKQGDYLFSRVIQHGRRRSEEMRASAQMIDATAVAGIMALGAAHRQASVAEARAAGTFDEPTKLKPWRERADEWGTFLNISKKGRAS